MFFSHTKSASVSNIFLSQQISTSHQPQQAEQSENRLEMLLGPPNIYDITHHRLTRWALLLTIQMLVPFESSKNKNYKNLCVFFKRRLLCWDKTREYCWSAKVQKWLCLRCPPKTPGVSKNSAHFIPPSRSPRHLSRAHPHKSHSQLVAWCALASKPSKPKTLACRRRCRRGSLRSRPRPTLASQQP